MAGLGNMKKPRWIVANWKSNKTISEALDWIKHVGPQLPRQDNLKIAVCPTFSALSTVAKIIKNNNYPIMIGAQDLSPFGPGAYTGEESAGLLTGLISLAILGHSERRQNFGETDELIAKKVQQAKENNIIPVVCMQDVDTPIPSGCRLVVFEPIFAIGTGNPDTPENASQTAGILQEKGIPGLEVLYGGSVNSDNVKGFTGQKDLSGVLIGNASLSAVEFIKICKVAGEIM